MAWLQHSAEARTLPLSRQQQAAHCPQQPASFQQFVATPQTTTRKKHPRVPPAEPHPAGASATPAQPPPWPQPRRPPPRAAAPRPAGPR